MIARLHTRMRRLRSGQPGDDGLVLVYVLIVTLLITTAVTGLLMTATQAITPTRQSQLSSAAYAAAEGGIQDALAQLNGSAACDAESQGYTIANCIGALNPPTATNPTGLPSGESFYWSAVGGVGSDIRLSATGMSGGVNHSLIADYQPVKGVFDYGYYTTYETAGTDELAAFYPARKITVSDPTACGDISGSPSCPASVAWNGASDPSATYSDSNCNRVWYNSTSLNPSSSDSSSTGRALREQTLQAAHPGTDWSEAGTVNGVGRTRYAPCQVAFTKGMTFDGPVYTADAPLISYQVPGGTSGPVFEDDPNGDGGLSTAWSATDTPGAPASPYRPDPTVGGAPTGKVSADAHTLTFSNAFSPPVPTGACVFYGPTRVLINGDGTATVTSPLTTAARQNAATPGCYTTNASGQFSFNYGTAGGGVIYVKNLGSTSGWTAAGPTNPIFRNASVAASPTNAASFEAQFLSDLQTAINQASNPSAFATASSLVTWANSWISAHSTLIGSVLGLLGASQAVAGSYTAPPTAPAAASMDGLLAQGSSSFDFQTVSCVLGICGKPKNLFAVTVSSGQFPLTNDITQYAAASSDGTSAPGDVYVQTASGASYTGNLSVLADHDAIVTGNINAGSGAGMDIDVLHDIRVYHPVACAPGNTQATNASGQAVAYCSNDITGLYTGSLVNSDGSFQGAHPAKQYTAIGPTLNEIDAALVAQGSSSSNGAFYTDNFNRVGNSAVQPLTVVGGVYQRHRGALGVQWEMPTSGATARATSGYTLNVTHQEYTSLPYVPSFQGGSPGHNWSIVSISSPPAGGS